MRHQVKSKQFNRDTKARQALLKGLVRSFIEHGQITTTKTKAKETKRISDKMIATAKQEGLATRRVLHRFFGKRDVVNTLVDKIAPLFPKHNSGFSRIVALGKRRGDNTPMARLELVEAKASDGLKSDKEHSIKKTAQKVVAKKTLTKKAVAKKEPVASKTEKKTASK